MSEPSTVYPIVVAASSYWDVSGGTTGDETRATSVRTKAAGLSLPLTVGQWEVEINLLVTNASSTPDVRFALALADSLIVTDSSFFMRIDTQNDTPGSENDALSGNFDASQIIQIAAGKIVQIALKITMTVTTAGTLDFNWGQSSTNASVTTLLKGATSKGHEVV